MVGLIKADKNVRGPRMPVDSILIKTKGKNCQLSKDTNTVIVGLNFKINDKNEGLPFDIELM